MSIYGVNGKIPLAAWVPSRDSVGNGTSTLRDLVGSYHGTLTNMDPATDWVSDTANGGVRALDFDGSNDFVSIASNSAFNFGTQNFTISAWIKTSQTTLGIWLGKDTDTARQWTCWGNLNEAATESAGRLVFFDNSAFANSFGTEASSLVSGSWMHVVHVRNGTSGLTYANGTLIRTKTISLVNFSTTSAIYIGGRQFPGFLNPLAMRLDDLRIWNGTALDASDVSYLYNSGNGRGRVVATNRNNMQMGVAF